MVAQFPKISVIVTAFNVGDYLGECLESIAAQNFADFECLVVDDGSTDATGAIADAFAARDARFLAIRQENRGVAGARNRGLDEARGAFISFVDGDDLCHPQMLQRLLDCLQAGDAPFAMCDYDCWVMDGRGGWKASGAVGSFRGVTADELDEHEMWVHHYADDDAAYILCWNKLYRRELFEDIRFRDGHEYEDLEIAHRLLAKARRGRMVRESLYLYRKHPKSVTMTKKPAQYLDVCESLIVRGSYFEERGWDDLRDETDLQLLGRVARTRTGLEQCDDQVKRRFAACRKVARAQAWGLLRRHWTDRRYVMRIIPFLMGEKVYLRLAARSSSS